MTVDILGTEYTVIMDADSDDWDGCCDPTTKVIKIAKHEPADDDVSDIGYYRDKVIIHEIVHAFLYESGLHANSGAPDAWATSEEIVDWIALQHDKVEAAISEVRDQLKRGKTEEK